MTKMKLKGIVIGLMIMAFSLVSSHPVLAADPKIGYVNLSLVFDSYEKTKKFDRDLQKKAEEKRTQRDKIVEEVKKNRDELELLSPNNRVAMQQKIDQKVQELQAFDRDSRLTLRRHRDTMIRDILKEIDEVVQNYGKEEGYDYIFNDRILLFKKEANDLSQEIVDLLNA